MASVQRRHVSSKVCVICGKGDSVKLNRPHSLKRTKSTVKPNLQKRFGVLACQTCFRTLAKNQPKNSPKAS